MNPRNALLAGTAVAVAGLISYCIIGLPGCDSGAIAPASGFTRTGLKAGLQAPNITGPDLEGNLMALAEFKGKVVVLEFWSPT